MTANFGTEDLQQLASLLRISAKILRDVSELCNGNVDDIHSLALQAEELADRLDDFPLRDDAA